MSESNTASSFKDKWEKNETLAWEQTLTPGADTHTWILSRNGFESDAALRAFLVGKRRVLDAGCGNGRVTALLRTRSQEATTEIVAIDLVAADVAAKNLASYRNVRILPGDLLGDLSQLGTFDFIYCQEVLHHTRDPRAAFLNLCTRLDPGGEIAIYVYKRKAPAREYVDDFVRRRVSGMQYDQAIAVCDQITALGKALADQKVTLTLPGVDVLEIPAGQYDLQRFVYHFFMKCFWNDAFTFKENSAINYDWYHPDLCSRHTAEEVDGWFRDAGLEVVHRFVDFYGITYRGVRRK